MMRAPARMTGSERMHIKAPLEFVWRPIAEAIGRWLDGPRIHLGDFLEAFLISGLIALAIIAWAVTST